MKNKNRFLAGSGLNALVDSQFATTTIPVIPVIPAQPITDVSTPDPKFKLFTVEAKLHAAADARDQWAKLFSPGRKPLGDQPLTEAERKRRQRELQKAEEKAKANAFAGNISLIMSLFKDFFVNAAIAHDDAEYRTRALHLFKQRHAFRRFLEKLPPEKFNVILNAWLELIRPVDYVDDEDEDIYSKCKTTTRGGTDAEKVFGIATANWRRTGGRSIPAKAVSPKGHGSQEEDGEDRKKVQKLKVILREPTERGLEPDEDSVEEQKLALVICLLTKDGEDCTVCGESIYGDDHLDNHLAKPWRIAKRKRKEREDEYDSLGLTKFLPPEEEDPHVPAVRKLMRKPLEALQDMKAEMEGPGDPVDPMTFRRIAPRGG